jgi:hypothetical protein
MKLRVLFFLLAIFLPTLACSSLPIGDAGGADPALPANVLFQDDFSDTSSGWDRVNQPEGITDYNDGVYRIFVNTVNTDIWANPGLDFSDVRVQVEATKVGGSDNNDFGVICRYQDPDNYYFFLLSSDGYYGIGKVKDGQQQLIGMDAMLPSEAIIQGDATNILRADCIGPRLSLYANDEFLDQFEDSDLATGDVGLIAGTSPEAPGTDIHFDNFQVLKP